MDSMSLNGSEDSCSNQVNKFVNNVVDFPCEYYLLISIKIMIKSFSTNFFFKKKTILSQLRHCRHSAIAAL